MKYTKAGGTVGLRIIQKGHAPEGFADYDFVVKDNGIGMAITKNIVDMMGGTIKVKSELGVGSEFTISLRFKTTQQNSKRSWSYSILCETVVCIRIIRCTAERKPSCEDKR
jgi:signal transduction histidine kinase